MKEATTRTFEDHDARREAVPLLVGLYGPSGTGKTFSALRLATGIQRVMGGDIFVIDTEAKRALHYAEGFGFRFRHVPFAPPFGSMDYLAAIRHCVSRGAKIIVIDSFSHEHEGEGGHLEAHEREIDRLVAAAEEKGRTAYRDSYNMQAWIPLKRARTAMIQGILQMGVTLIGCFRAKEKVKPTKDKKIVELGWQPIGADEIFYEMTVTCLLRPGCGGVPSWKAEQEGERPMIKLPAQFRDLLLPRTEPLSEDVGAALAKWAAGDEASASAEIAAVDGAIARIAAIGDAGSGDDLTRYIDTEVAPRFPARGAHGPRIGAAVDAAWAKINAKAAPAPKATNGGGRTGKPATRPPPDRRAAIATQLGITPELVAAIERFAGGGDSEATIRAALKADGFAVDEGSIADVLAELRRTS